MSKSIWEGEASPYAPTSLVATLSAGNAPATPPCPSHGLGIANAISHFSLKLRRQVLYCNAFFHARRSHAHIHSALWHDSKHHLRFFVRMPYISLHTFKIFPNIRWFRQAQPPHWKNLPRNAPRGGRCASCFLRP